MSNLRERLVAAIHPAKMECGIDAEAVRRVMEAILPIIESELQSACALVLERAAVICKAKAVYANRSAHGKDDLFKGLLRELENILYDTAKNISELIRNYAQIIAEHDAQVRADAVPFSTAHINALEAKCTALQEALRWALGQKQHVWNGQCVHCAEYLLLGESETGLHKPDCPFAAATALLEGK